MAPMNNFFRAARPVFRNTFFTSNAARQGGKRFQSTASSEQAQESFFKRMWNSPVGFKTVHFWYVFLGPDPAFQVRATRNIEWKK